MRCVACGREPPPPLRGPPPRKRGGFDYGASFRRLRKLGAMQDFVRAALHRRRRAADGVGEVEVLDRQAYFARLGLRVELRRRPAVIDRSEEHTSELQSLMRTSYAVFCLKKKKNKHLV